MIKQLVLAVSLIIFLSATFLAENDNASIQPNFFVQDVCANSINSIVSSNQWVRTYTQYSGGIYRNGDLIQHTTDGGYISVQGIYSDGSDTLDILVLKLNFDGRIAWQKTFGGNGGDMANAIHETADGGFIMTGHTDSFNGPPTQGDAFVIKLNKDGNIVWQKSYGDGGNKVDVGEFVRETADGGYVLVGWTAAFGAGNVDIWLLKLDSNGDIVWQNTYGGAAWDEPKDIYELPQGGFIVTGRTYSYGAGLFDFWVLAINSSGSFIWGKTYGGSQNEVPLALQATNDGGYLVAGYEDSFGTGDSDVWILKLNAGGSILWQKRYGGPDDDYMSAMQQTADGNIVLAGQTRSFGAGEEDLWLMKLNSNGNIIWQHTYGGTELDVAFSMDKTEDDGFVVLGATNSYGGEDESLWILKLDKYGEIPSCGIKGISNAEVFDTNGVWQYASYISQSSYAITTEINMAHGTGSAETSSICDFGPPSKLTINYPTGKPGSVFTLKGSNFPSSNTADVIVNGHTMTNTLPVNEKGELLFLLTTEQAGTGHYFVTVAAGSSATERFALDVNEPNRLQEDIGEVLQIPSGIAFNDFVYLPLIQR